MNIFKHQCACGIEFKQKKNLYAHMRKQHNIEPLKQLIKVENYECDLCGRKFVCQSSIIRHLRKNHSDSNNKLIGVNKKISLLCPYGECSENFRTYEILREHLAKKHCFQLEFEELSFDSVEDFEQWKDSMQLQTASLYTQSTAGRTLRIELGRRLYYNCHRSNVYNRRGNNIRTIKSLGSNKIGRACPSRLEVTYTAYAGQTIIKVKFWKSHCGHTTQVERLPLNRQMKCLIAEKLGNGYTFEQILEWSHEIQELGDVTERLQLISRKDLYNIVREFNIAPLKKKRNKKLKNAFKIIKNNNSMANYSQIDNVLMNNSKNNYCKSNNDRSNEPSTSKCYNIDDLSINCQTNDRNSAILSELISECNDISNTVPSTDSIKNKLKTNTKCDNDLIYERKAS